MQAARRALATPGAWAVLLVTALASSDAQAGGATAFTSASGLFALLAIGLALQGWMGHGGLGAPLAWSGVALLLGTGATLLWWPPRREKTQPQPGRAGAFSGGVDATAMPPGHQRLLDEAKRHFVQVQAAWDRADVARLRELTAWAMFEELCAELPDANGPANHTEVLTLDAQLLGFEQWGGAILLTVEFSGMMREAPEWAAMPFRELWMLTRPKDGASGWRLARHQALL